MVNDTPFSINNECEWINQYQSTEVVKWAAAVGAMMDDVLRTIIRYLLTIIVMLTASY